jgi:uncharacterized protein YrrD
MKRSMKSFIDYAIGATDGEIGKVKEVYFDDHTWTIRYLIVETGSWLNGRKVLISPVALLTTDWKNKTFPVNLTKEQIKNSPDIDTELPVSRQEEIKLYEHYSWGSYWGGGNFGLGVPVSMYDVIIDEDKKNTGKEIEGDPHLRSSHKVTGYSIKATDGRIGEIEDFIIDDGAWKINFLVVDTGHWFPGKKVLISPEWIKEIDWLTSSVIINASVERVKNSPEYDASQPVNEAYEENLHDYYGRLVSH